MDSEERQTGGSVSLSTLHSPLPTIAAIRLFEADWAAARDAWRDVDPKLYAATPPEPVDRLMEVTPTAFGALVRSIIHQQVSVLAGRAIVGRLRDACGGELDAARIIAFSDDELRAAGLSRAKVRYVRALAEVEVGGELETLEHEPDDEIHRRLIALPGVGIWTVKMFLLFHVQRPDVFAGEDLGLREAIRVLDGTDAPPTIHEAHARAEVWAPYRSVAAVSLWDFLRRSRLPPAIPSPPVGARER